MVASKTRNVHFIRIQCKHVPYFWETKSFNLVCVYGTMFAKCLNEAFKAVFIYLP